jgi:hypothetical protein
MPIAVISLATVIEFDFPNHLAVAIWASCGIANLAVQLASFLLFRKSCDRPCVLIVDHRFILSAKAIQPLLRSYPATSKHPANSFGNRTGTTCQPWSSTRSASAIVASCQTHADTCDNW